MKALFTTSGNTLDAPLDSRFGRAPKFLVVDLETGGVTVIDNRQSLDAAQGAGIQAAETVSRAGVNCVVTGHCGPKAYRALAASGITVYPCAAETVADALEQLRSGKLVAAASANADGHWV